jgi:2-dehydropantoate 2-reductase
MDSKKIPFPRVAVVGAGAMGSLFAVRLASTGVAVTVVDVDCRRLALIEREGLTLVDDAGVHSARVAAVTGAEAPAVDLVILFTKGIHSAAAIASVAHLAAHRPAALTLQNGLGNAELLARTFGRHRVVLGTSHVPADLSGPARVESHGPAEIEIGDLSSASHNLARAVAAQLRAARFAVNIAEDIAVSVWEKVAFNAALNAPAMICRATNAGLDNEPGRRLALRVVDEAVAVAGAAGIALDRPRIAGKVAAALREHPLHKASMLQDRDCGRSTEIDTINGAISREGARFGVPTAACDTLCDLVRIIELGANVQSSPGQALRLASDHVAESI